MKEINIDNEFLNKIKTMVYPYEDKIPEGIYYYYDDILKGNNLEMYMQTYSLTKEELLKYARIVKIMEIYKEISDLVDILKDTVDELKKDEVDEYKEIIDELQVTGEEYMSDFDLDEEDNNEIENLDNANLIIYPSYINESKEKTINAHSGKEEKTQKAVANLIEQISKLNYQELRSKGYIHQNQEMGNNKACYVDGNAFERMGRGSTKVNYIRISVSEKNRNELKNYLNMEFDTFYFVICYGDFKNEGIDELKYFNEIYINLKKHMDEILFIINIFKNDFTNETRPIALALVNDGFKITEDLTKILKDKKI